MKANLILLLMIFNIMAANAQVKNKMKVGFDLGIIVSGLAVRIEPKYNLTSQSSVGLRLGATLEGARKITTYQGGYIETSSLAEFFSISFLSTYDQYFRKDGSGFVWFIGGGIGYHSSTGEVYYDGDFFSGPSPSFDAKVKGQLAWMLRSGFEAGKFRFSLEYNFIPKADIVISTGKTIGYVQDSNIGATLGFVIGGGEWKKNNSK